MYERGLAHAWVADHDNLQDIFVCKLAQTKTTKFQIIVNYREQPHGTWKIKLMNRHCLSSHLECEFLWWNNTGRLSMEGYNCLNRDSTYLILENHSARVIFRLNILLWNTTVLSLQKKKLMKRDCGLVGEGHKKVEGLVGRDWFLQCPTSPQ